ncbi:MAG: LPXTG cell wall anchor domain-containing protein [Rothia sp. (in: high G+C Gram-positive bacteria)]|uniref:LPXTG cell wall anchor domain-containing protein n=1 Tax=Rothia sp. (in: high G+C Gram-positive bacteria) TaxID=1885016 RepID=UPI00271084D1|nr:LPXTG cell wall anchor domain-containing protein [Rothia sp. (in: high G+C Gram-positive bacteria)]
MITREAASQLSDNPTSGASVEPSATSSAAPSADSSTSPEAGEPTDGVRASDSDAGVAGADGVAADPALKPTQQSLAGAPSRSAGSLPGSEAQQAVSGQQSSSGGGGLASTGASVLGIAAAGALALGAGVLTLRRRQR